MQDRNEGGIRSRVEEVEGFYLMIREMPFPMRLWEGIGSARGKLKGDRKRMPFWWWPLFSLWRGKDYEHIAGWEWEEWME